MDMFSTEEALFKDRAEAGKRLADALEDYARESPIILAIPRGGVVVAHEISKKLNCALDIVVPRKIGAQYNPELAIGAVAEDGSSYIDETVVSMLGASKAYIDKKIEEEKKEISRRVEKYRQGLKKRVIKGRVVILVDDGIATGYTAIAAARFIKKQKPRKLVLAVPVAPKQTLEKIREEVDDVVCLYSPASFMAIGQFYEKFEQISDDEVIRILGEAR